ncbi:hypothetical protein AYL99_11534 [Fonsecaea erecta]|uniref:Uncharacterized protein n=1 Tax=Fonsecaea erecta TaxID=1367422 RepID=A0A178Z5I0_9EURO|nr:hypothetical protein AYL99_11534 [Fonsecaea erecta]OAP54433.1 hypothetical protein AYL99_11534 [Fonsecaea erecta]
MSDQPPPYEEIAAGNPAPLGPSSALVVHLQVWHDRSEGRSPANNDRLAALFRNHNLQNWEVVPLEVRFRHRIWAYDDPGEHPMADVRELFFKIAPQFIYEFFIGIRSTPHNLNIFPVGVPEGFRSRYSHAYILNRLSIRVNAFFVPGPVMTNDVQSWLREAVNTVDNVLDILAEIVCLYLRYRQAQSQGNGNGQAGTQYGTQGAYGANVNWPPQLQELQTLLQQFMQPNGQGTAQPGAQIADVQVALNGAARPLQQYLRLANRMESRLTKLGTNQTLSNQDLYELVQDSHNAALHFSTLKQAVRPLVRLLEENYSDLIKIYRTNRSKRVATGAVIAAVAIFCFWNPAGWAAAGAYGAGFAVGGAAGAGVHMREDAELGKAFKKKDTVREFDLAVKEIDRCANQARKAIATVYYAQVMQMPLDDTLPEHARRILLASLGVDVDAVSSAVYNEELIRDRLRRFCENNSKLRTRMKSVLADANFDLHTTETA